MDDNMDKNHLFILHEQQVFEDIFLMDIADVNNPHLCEKINLFDCIRHPVHLAYRMGWLTPGPAINTGFNSWDCSNEVDAFQNL